MPKKDILRASISVSTNFIYSGLKRVLIMMGLAGAIGFLIMLSFVAVIAAIIK